MGELYIEDNLFIYSGGTIKKQAEVGVGCVVSPAFKKRIVNWKGVNFKYTENGIIRIKVVYGPSENEKTETKVYEDGKNMVVMGDLNARNGNRVEGTEK